MDANLQRSFQLADDDLWSKLGTPPRVQYDRARRVLRLASSRRSPGWVEDELAARSFLEWVPGSVDRFGTRARWDGIGKRVMATGAFGDELAIYTAVPPWIVHDVAIGYDDVLYLSAGGRVVLKDLRDRWEPVDLLITPGFNAWRLAPAPSGGTYCLDRVFHKIGRVTGLPMRERTGIEYAPGTFRPVGEDRDPPRTRVLQGATWPAADEREVAIACSPDGRLALLTWDLHGGDARLRILGEDERFGAPVILQGVRWPHSLAWVDAERVAVMIARTDSGNTEEAPVYEVTSGAIAADPVGDLFPLREHRRGTPFLHGASQPPEYPTEAASRPLLHISWPSFADVGTATNARAIDSGEPHTIWHRLYLEASIPPGCGARVWLATTSELRPPGDEAAWHEHRFGAVPAEPSVDVPRGVWLRDASEVPFFPGLLGCERRPDRSGLWMALIQRPRYRVRSLVGRYLWVRLDLHGDGRSTPEVAALRAYGGRRSYVQNYLPELYHESVFGPEADVHGDPATDGGDGTAPGGATRVPSTGADFLERFVATFESVLTPIEDRIANSWLLTDPQGAPEEAIEWLASWIGLSFASALPVDRRRAMLENAMELYRRRGTLRGLGLALDLATGGAVTRGQIVIFEDFRLRRTFATILGANLAEEDDPLLPGLMVSGNSFVGDTLFLGEDKSASNREFLALFNADLAVSTDEAAAVDNLFERLAHRATVLVHNEVDEQELGLIRQIVDREAPAHVAVQVLPATERFLVGMSSLVGIDTFLGVKPAPQPVRVDVSNIGRLDLITHLASLDPRLGESPSEQPSSGLAATPPAEIGTAFTLDGSSSRAASGRRIVRYHWKRID